MTHSMHRVYTRLVKPQYILTPSFCMFAKGSLICCISTLLPYMVVQLFCQGPAICAPLEMLGYYNYRMGGRLPLGLGLFVTIYGRLTD